MARIRSIKPEFWKSEAIACHDFFTRLVFIGLWTYVDDNGVGLDNHRLIAAELFPLEEDFAAVSRDLRESLAKLADAGRIRRYTVNGKSYLAVVNWREHQKIDRPGKARYPEPDNSDATSVPAATSENTPPHENPDETSRDSREGLAQPQPPDQGSGIRDQGNRGTGNNSAREPRAGRGTRIPDDFAVTPEMVAWATTEAPTIDGRRETAAFVDYWRAVPGSKGVKTDWIATWRNWMRRAQDNQRPTAGNAVATRTTTQRPSTTDQRVADGLAIAARFDAMEANA